MTHLVGVRRYARVLYDEAGASVLDDMVLIQDTLASSPALARCLASPIVAADRKRAVLKAVFAARTASTTWRFLSLLVERKREDLLLPIAHAYAEIIDEQRGITSVHARVPFVLTEAQQKQITEALQKQTGGQVRLTTVEDRSLIGGLVLRIGDVVYDGSITNQLSRLRSSIDS